MEKEKHTESASRQPDNGATEKGKKSKTYKHVKLEHKRPQLTKGGEAGDGAQKKRKPTQKKRSSSAGKDPKAKLKIIPLGGLDAIGKNMTVFECGNDMIVDDAGLMFPDDNHPGVDLILPDYTYVLEHADKLRGIVITHGHEDHTGTIPYLLKDLDRPVPIYATKLTLGLIEGKLAEHRIKNAKLVEIKPGQQVKMGCFTTEFFAVNHSIPGAVGVFLQSPAGNVLHTGDFKLDQTPIDGVHFDFGALARYHEIGVDLMMSDSTNATKSTFTPSEAEVGKTLNRIISQAKQRVIIASFASHIHRMQQICDAARANGRKVVVTGRSMVQNTDIARKLGYLNIPDEDLIDAYELKGIPPEKVVIMCTGSQGVPLSAVAGFANGEHLTIDIEEGDKSRARVHVSGHAGAEELKIVLSIVQPKSFMPVHGESTHLRAHARLAEATGVPKDNIFLCENGESLELTPRGVHRGEVVQSGIVYVDGLSVGDTSQDVLDERCALGEQGFACIAAAVSLSRHEVQGEVQVEMRGITGGDDAYLAHDAEAAVKSALRKALGKNATLKEAKKAARDALLSLLWERTKQRPMVIANLLEI